jgi:hypothetical protein
MLWAGEEAKFMLFLLLILALDSLGNKLIISEIFPTRNMNSSRDSRSVPLYSGRDKTFHLKEEDKKIR